MYLYVFYLSLPERESTAIVLIHLCLIGSAMTGYIATSRLGGPDKIYGFLAKRLAI